jgi:hypothetical protein
MNARIRSGTESPERWNSWFGTPSGLYILSVVSYRNIARWAFRLALVLTSLVASPALSSLVVCLGDDGHLEVEYSVDGRCGSHQGEHESSNLTHEQAGHCGTCLDFSISSVDESALRTLRGIDLEQVQVLFPVAMATSVPVSVPTLLPRPPPSDPGYLTHLRTIRLLV